MSKLRESLSHIAACGLPPALEVMGDRWSFLILRAAFNGFVHFEEFSSELGIARNILSDRLTRMVENGVLERQRCEHDKRKIEYCLTQKGQDLLPTMLALRQWGARYCADGPMNPVLVDKEHRRPIRPIVIQAEDGRAIDWADLEWCDRSEVARDA